MFVDSEDYIHLTKNLNNELPRLKQKIEIITNKINKRYKKLTSVNLKTQKVDWKNPDTKTQWSIYFGYNKSGKETNIQNFIFLTKILGEKVTDYLAFESINTIA